MTEATPDPNAAPGAGRADTITPKPTFEQRVEGFGREMGAAGERLGREAEAAGQRLANDPTIQRAGETAVRLWGLIVLAAGLWFLADVTLKVDMPNVPWDDVWPPGLILLGVFIVVRGMGRRRA
ncbi:MAG: hypothetical protein HYX55_06935 [Chloroflexi bacterium]|nr:hypothetical protein [Chloroflexota bacterium]